MTTKYFTYFTIAIIPKLPTKKNGIKNFIYDTCTYVTIKNFLCTEDVIYTVNHYQQVINLNQSERAHYYLDKHKY